MRDDQVHNNGCRLRQIYDYSRLNQGVICQQRTNTFHFKFYLTLSKFVFCFVFPILVFQIINLILLFLCSIVFLKKWSWAQKRFR